MGLHEGSIRSCQLWLRATGGRRCLPSERASRSLSRAFVEAACGLNVSFEEAGLMGEDDRLHAVAEVQLLKVVRDMGLDGGVADVELVADLHVGESARDQSQHVQLAIGQVGEFAGRFWVRDAGELLDHALRSDFGTSMKSTVSSRFAIPTTSTARPPT